MRTNFREGRFGNAAKKVGSALWKRKGDIAAMALGAAGTRKLGKRFVRASARAGMRIRKAPNAAFYPRGDMSVNRFAAQVRKGIGDFGRTMAGGKGMLAGALSALATKKAVGFAGRTAMRAGRWAKRKVFGESNVVFVTGIRLSEGTFGAAGEAVKNTMRTLGVSGALRKIKKAKQAQKSAKVATAARMSNAFNRGMGWSQRYGSNV